MGNILIDPTYGCRSFIVVADVAHELAARSFTEVKTPREITWR